MRTNNNISQAESRSSRRKTITLRNAFSHDTNNQLSEIYSNYCQATARPEQLQQHQGYEEHKMHTNQQYYEIIKQQYKKQQGNSLREICVAKDELIKKLEANNKNIIQQVQDIWEKIHTIQQTKQPVKKHRKLVQKETNYQKLQKDLANAYKSIKIAEKEIDMYRKKQQSSGQFILKIKKLKQDLSQRQTISNRLKEQLALKAKQLKETDKFVGLLAQKSEVNQLKVLSQEFENLMGVTKETEKRYQQRIKILKKQYISLKKIQRQLVQKGMSEFELQQIKKQCMRQFPTKKQLQQRKKDYQINIQQTFNDQKKEKVEQFTRTNYNAMLYEINLLKKKQVQFDKEYQAAKAAKNHYAEMNREIEQKLRDCQREYEQLDNLNQKLRSKHIQQHRHAKIQAQKPQPSIQSLRKSLILKNRKQLSKQKNIRFKSLPNSLNAQNNSKQSFVRKRNCSFGKGSPGSNKFNDKYVLGNEHKSKKIVGINIYYQPIKSWITGISIIYEQGIKGGDYVWRVTDKEVEYKSQSYECGQSQIKDIIPTFMKQNDKYRLIGLDLILQNGHTKLFGKSNNKKSKLSEKQYVSCMFGSMSIIDLNSNKVSVIQELGFQIYE